MCGLCGAFGVVDHWTDQRGTLRTAAADRHHRARLANTILAAFRLRLEPWGTRFVLRGATGRTEVVDHFGALWPAAERLAGRPLDPFEPALLARLGDPAP